MAAARKKQKKQRFFESMGRGYFRAPPLLYIRHIPTLCVETIEQTIKNMKTENATLPDYSEMPLSRIASEIRKNWPKIYFGAKPYLEAMTSLDSINDAYGFDSGKSIVRYFLCNAATFRGEAAKAIKAELNKRLKQ